jgi:outer membrane protein TolC
MRYFLLLVVFYTNALYTQNLSIEEYLSWVIQEHPLTANAKLLTEKGNAQWLQTKGLFDPVLTSKWKNKFYSDKNYYQQSTTTLEVPTPFAVGLNAQLDFNNGAFINPEDVIPNNGLASIGISLPVLQGLIIDERRMAKQRAERIQAMSELETTIAINELLFQSCEFYLDWLISEKKVSIQNGLLQAANQRHEATKARFLGGDRAALDTLESFIQKETRKQQFQDATLENIKVRLAMVAFKNNQNKSSILNKTIIPEPTAFQKITSVLFSSPEIERQFQQHPEIIWYQTKADILLIEQKWKKEQLKPKLNLEYNFLNKPIENSAYSFSTENYKWGVDFSIPLLLREARGDLKMQQVKILENQNNLLWKKQQILQKIEYLQTQQTIMRQQFSIAQQNSLNGEKLLQGENIKFNNGESSVFLVNQRENYYLDQQQKALDYERKWIQSHVELRYLLFLPYTIIP